MRSLILAAVVVCAWVANASAALIAPGDVVVTMFDGGGAALSSAGTTGKVLEYLPTTANQASPVQTIALPTTASGGNAALTFSGTATSEGFITLSSNGQYLTVAGYNAAVGTAGITNSTTTARTLGRIDVTSSTPTIDTTTTYTNTVNTGNPRSVVSDNGSNFWIGTSAGGVRYTTLGASGAGNQLTTTPSNARVVNIVGGQLYTSSASTPIFGPATVGSGLPTSGTQTATLLNGFPTSGTHSSYDYFFSNANTVYVADDGVVGAGGGIQKWTQASGTWSLQYTLLNNGTTTTGTRSLAGYVDGSGNAVLFAVSSAVGTPLITLTDTGAGSLATVLATAATNTAFRGVEFIPAAVPEITSFAMVGLVGVGGLLYRRRKQSAKA